MQIIEYRVQGTACDSTEYIVQSKYQNMVQIPEYRVQSTEDRSTEHRVHCTDYREEITNMYRVQGTADRLRSTEHKDQYRAPR